jgi:patatin-like phospholipase/acyl hydrolase
MTFRILALSGGGYLGLYSAHVLTRLEATMGRPIARSFDLICGTSIGAITALALSLEVPAAEIERAFIAHGPKIFPQIGGRFRGVKRTYAFGRSMFKPKYSDGPLRDAIESLVSKDNTLADSKYRLVLPVVNMTSGQVEVFKTPHLATWTHHAPLKMVDVGLAAAAAPTFFPLAEVRDSLYVDGAVYANAPDLVGVHEAQYYLQQQLEDIEVLSIGTTTAAFSMPHRWGRDYGAFRWLKGGRVFSTIMAAQQQLLMVFLRHQLGERFVRIDSIQAPGVQADLAFDGATEHCTKTIKGLAEHAFEEALKHRQVRDILAAEAPPPVFYPQGMPGLVTPSTPLSLVR